MSIYNISSGGVYQAYAAAKPEKNTGGTGFSALLAETKTAINFFSGRVIKPFFILAQVSVLLPDVTTFGRIPDIRFLYVRIIYNSSLISF